MHYVYSHDFDGGISEAHRETRYKCLKWVKMMTCIGRPTHFYFISKLGYEDAKKRYARG